MVHFAETEGIENKIFLVTGGAGFVGSAICLELMHRGAAEVRSFDIKKDIQTLRSKGVNCIVGDVKRKGEIERAMRGANCVFHVASHGMIGKQSLQARKTDEVNLDGTCNVIDACVKNGVERLVYTSTNNVIFGGQPITNGNEAMNYFPVESHVDSYGRSKSLAEQLILKSNNRPLKGKEGRKLRTCALRPGIVYGPGEEHHLPKIINIAKLGLFFFRIGQSNVKTDWIYVDNLVNAHLLASMALLDDVPGREGNPVAAGKAYFVSDDAPANYFDFIRPIIIELGYKFPSWEISVDAAARMAWFLWGVYGLGYPWLEKSWFPQPVLLPSEVYKVGVTHTFSSWRARQELGYTPLVDRKDGMQRTIGYLKDRQSKEVQVPTFGWWVAVNLGLFILFCTAFVPSPFMGPFECFRSLGILLHGSVRNLQVVFVMALFAHLLEASYAWWLAKRVDPKNATGWFFQTLNLGFPSLRLLLGKAKQHRQMKQHL